MASIANMLGGGTAAGAGKFIPTLQQASTLVQQILRDVESLDKALSSVVAKAAAVRGSLAGAPAGYGVTPSGLFAPAGPASAAGIGMPTVSFGGTPATNGGSPGGTDGDGHRKFGWGSAIGTAAVAGFFGSATNQVAQGTQDEILFNRLRTLNAGAFSQSGGYGALRGLYSANGAAGYIGAQDLTGAVGSAFASGQMNVTNPSFARQMAAVSQMTNTTLSQSMSAMMSASSNPFDLVRLQSMGVNLLDHNGNMKSPERIAAALQGPMNGNYKTPGQVKRAFSVFGGMRQQLEQLGISDDDITNVYMPYFSASQQTGFNIGAPGFDDAMKSAGFGNTRFGTSARKRSDSQVNLLDKQFGSMMKAAEEADKTAAAFNNLTASIDVLQKALGAGKGAAGAFGQKQDGTGGIGSTVNSLAHDYFDYKVFKMLGGKGGSSGPGLLKRLLGKLRGGGGIAGDAELGGEAAGGLEAGGLLAGSAALGPVAGLAALGVGGYAYYQASKNAPNFTADSKGILRADSGGGGYKTGDTANFGRFGQIGLGASHNWGMGGGGLGMGATTTGDSGGGTGHSQGASISASSLAQFAEKYIGTPYSWGGGGVGGPSGGFAQGAGTVGFDCSSFMQFIFAHYGVMLPRTTFDQARVGVTVSPREAMPGDLLFFDGPPSAPGHVGMYLGNGQMIEAPHTGSSVRVRSVDPASAVLIKRVINAKGTVGAYSQGGGNASGAPANSYASFFGTLTSDAIGRAQSLAGVGGGLAVTPGAMRGGTPTGSAASGAMAAPTNASGAAAIGKQMAAAMGWTGAEWNSLNALWTHESNWNPNAVNKSSGAYGIPQALGHGHPFNLGDARAQIAWGLNYIKGRYGDPNAAWAHEKQVGWYDKGAWRVKGDQEAVVHNDEMILPKTLADQVRTVLTGGGAAGGVGGAKTVELNVYPASADETAARRLATMVMEILEEDHSFKQIASN